MVYNENYVSFICDKWCATRGARVPCKLQNDRNTLSTVKCRYKVVQYDMILHTATVTASALQLTGELWGVYFDKFWENRLRGNGTALQWKSSQGQQVKVINDSIVYHYESLFFSKLQ